MCGGLNRFTFHTGTHNPPEAGKPGWAYHAGTHINVNRVWWPKIKPFIDYLSRSCYLLQQGHFVGDVCYYYGGQAPNFVKPKHVDPSLGAGYDYDVTNSEAIVTRMSVEKGRIVLPDGMSYELLVLPERDDMDLDVLMKLEKLVKGGATVYGPKPTRSNGLNDYKARDAKVRRLSNRLWGNCDGVEVKKHTYGKGKIIYGRSLRDILLERKIGPDFTYDSQNEDSVLDYIHRKTDNEDIYFVSNKTMKWINADCMFRVTGKVPELWEPYTGNIQKLAIYETVGGETKLPLRLPPMGSVFVVFRAKSNQPHLTTILPEFSSCEASSTDDGRIELTIANNGQYTLEAVGDQSLMLEIDDLPSPIEITGPWEVRFPEGWGAPVVTTFPELISWTQAKEEGIQFFSGIAAYHKVFEIPASLVSENYRLTLDLGGVKDIADVYINNEQVSILWKPPFQVDITDQVKSGKNHLAVEIANQWSNRLVGDSKLPIEKRFTNTNITYSIMWKQPWEKTPLLESGLLGPVRIHVSKKLSVQIPSQ